MRCLSASGEVQLASVARASEARGPQEAVQVAIAMRKGALWEAQVAQVSVDWDHLQRNRPPVAQLEVRKAVGWALLPKTKRQCNSQASEVLQQADHVHLRPALAEQRRQLADLVLQILASRRARSAASPSVRQRRTGWHRIRVST